MEMTPVTSSLLKAVAYDPEKEELHVELRKGGKYIYREVTLPVYKALLQADSPGHYFLTHIRGQYGFKKVEE